LESHTQSSLFDFYERFSGRYPELNYAFHVPNGGHRHIAVARQLRAQGVKRGVPDVLLPCARKQYIGLAIELKHGRNRTSSDQNDWIEFLRIQDWYVLVTNDWQHAAAITLLYLGHNPADCGLTTQYQL
jgi:hypothetical protein